MRPDGEKKLELKENARQPFGRHNVVKMRRTELPNQVHDQRLLSLGQVEMDRPIFRAEESLDTRTLLVCKRRRSNGEDYSVGTFQSFMVSSSCV